MRQDLRNILLPVVLCDSPAADEREHDILDCDSEFFRVPADHAGLLDRPAEEVAVLIASAVQVFDKSDRQRLT